MNFSGSMRILGTSDTAEWQSVLDASRQYDFHHLSQYHRVPERRGEGTAQLFVFRAGDHMIALPLVLRPVDPSEPEGWYDATSVYGYGGPVVSDTELSTETVRSFQMALADELAKRRVIAVFSRLHPLMEQSNLLAGLGECPFSGETLSIDLTLPDETHRSHYSRSCRASIRKLREGGFVSFHDREKRYLPEFVSVYRETMCRTGAHSSYLFDEAYFDFLTRELGAVLHLFVILKDGAVAAATLCTICNGIVQDHLGGTRDAFLKCSPDRLIVDSERAWAMAEGARVFHLGGGVGAQPDSLFRYKAGFSSRRHTFRTWRWIVQPGVYEELCVRASRWNAANGLRDASSTYFPAYRCPARPAMDDISAAGARHFTAKEGCVGA